MANRPGRSSSIPIPRNTSSSSTRNIESVISIPSISPARPRLSSTQGSSHRSGFVNAAINAPGSHRSTHDPLSVSVSPTRLLSRSGTLSSSISSRPSARPNLYIEPRVVHATPDTPRSVDNACAPSQSPTQTRRASGVSGRSASAQRQTPSVPPLPNTSPVSFPRPAYLEHSALRDFLVTDSTSVSPGLIPPRKAEPTPPARLVNRDRTPSTESDEDSTASPPPPVARDARPVPTAVLPEEQVTYPLPTRWSDQARSPSLSVSHDGRDISHHGANNNGEKDHAANARANHCVPPACGIYYYEVEVKSKEQKSHISIGFGSPTVKYSRLPGWEKDSWGYYGDDGHAYENGRGGGVTYAQTFGSGDVIGCGIDFANHQIFYTKNQAYLGYVFDDVGKDADLYPVVGLRHSGDSVRINFGHEPFLFDIEDHVQQRRNATWTSIMKTPLNSILLHRRYHKHAIKSLITITDPPSTLTENESKSVLNQLVQSYLVHHGYAKTARAFHKQQSGDNKLSESDVDMDASPERAGLDDFEGDIERRTSIVNAVIGGDIDSALEETRKSYPSVLEADDGAILFKLRCRKLVELILETNEIKRRMAAGKEREEPASDASGSGSIRQSLDDDGMNMDVDDDALSFASPTYPSLIQRAKSGSPGLSSTNKFDSRQLTTADFEAALTRAIEYGQAFNQDYKTEKRPELRQLFEQASSVIAWHNPLAAGGPTAEFAGPEARNALANEVNEAILKSQGRPVRPTLEMVYRHTAACMTQLGVTGVGLAVFADMPKEFLET